MRTETPPFAAYKVNDNAQIPYEQNTLYALFERRKDLFFVSKDILVNCIAFFSAL